MTKTSANNSGSSAGSEAKPGAATPDALEAYRSKRDPARTAEPFAAERKGSTDETRWGRFVVHLHAATRNHYDLRLQIGGTLMSFAVPKGPSLNPEERRLAINTEDHPLEYLDFEGVIPEGNYGGGALIVWDRGRVRYLEGTAQAGLVAGKLDFMLDGFKLKGRFALVHTGKRRGGKQQQEWLLFKKEDAFATTEEPRDSQPESVLSGMTVEQLAGKDAWAAELSSQARSLGAEAAPFDSSAFKPMLLVQADGPLDSPKHLYELKLDGVRIVAHKQGEDVTLRYRNGRHATNAFPEVVRALRTLAPHEVVLDGEVVALNDAGHPSLERLAPRLHTERPLDAARLSEQIPTYFWIFDLLRLEGLDLGPLSCLKRKRLLAQLLPGKGYLRVVDWFEGRGQELFDFCQQQGLEGVVAKETDGPYQPGPQRTGAWLKIKCKRDDDFVVIGWLPERDQQGPLGSLCLASMSGKDLVFRGRVGSGIGREAAAELQAKLAALETRTYACQGEPPEELSKARFVKPEVVVQVRYASFTEDGKLRAPVFLAVRPDRDPSECRARPPAEWLRAAEAPRISAPGPAGGSLLTNREKVFWPEEGYTKGELCDYYASVAPTMLRFLKDRPVVLVRYPDGIDGKSFYQWNVPAGTPSWLRSTELSRSADDAVPRRVFLLDRPEALIHVANLGCIPLHVLACRDNSREVCDFLTIDLDIGERPFADAIRLALSLRELLDELGLQGFPKTSGQKGLHVLVPLGGQVSFDTAKLLNELLGKLLTSRNSALATLERRVTNREGKVLVDIGQTGRSRTIVAPYSVRATKGATVSTPLFWSEVHLALDPRALTMFSVPQRLEELGDPLEAFLDKEVDIAEVLAQLGRLLGLGAG